MPRIAGLVLSTFLVGTAAPTIAACVDLTKGTSFSLTRDAPRFAVTNTISPDGSVIEERQMTRNGSVENVTTTYWTGIIAVDRKSASSRIQLEMPESAKLADLGTAGKSYSFPVSILVNGTEIDRGTYNLETMQKTAVALDGCRYSVMVVRTSIDRNGGDPLNEEALLSLEAGMLLGNVAMTPDWKPKHGVFYDRIKAN